MAVTALPRSPVNTASAPSGWCAATSAAVTSAAAAEPAVDTSTVTTRAPAARSELGHVGELAALGVEGPDDVGEIHWTFLAHRGVLHDRHAQKPPGAKSSSTHGSSTPVSAARSRTV